MRCRDSPLSFDGKTSTACIDILRRNRCAAPSSSLMRSAGYSAALGESFHSASLVPSGVLRFHTATTCALVPWGVLASASLVLKLMLRCRNCPILEHLPKVPKCILSIQLRLQIRKCFVANAVELYCNNSALIILSH